MAFHTTGPWEKRRLNKHDVTIRHNPIQKNQFQPSLNKVEFTEGDPHFYKCKVKGQSI